MTLPQSAGHGDHCLLVCLLLTGCTVGIARQEDFTPDLATKNTDLTTKVTVVTPSPPTTVLTHTPFPIPTSTLPSVPTPTASSMPSTPAHIPPSPGYVLQEEQFINGYVIHRWHNQADPRPWGEDEMLTIRAPGQPQEQIIEHFLRLRDETGTDITGEGNPDVVIETALGHFHSTIVYDLGSTPTKVLETPLSPCYNSFEDLDDDGVPEFVTCDTMFGHLCLFGPGVRVVLQYQPGQGYVPASPSFAHSYADQIAQNTKMAEEGQPGSMGEYDGTTKCSVLPLVLNYLYIGQPDLARTEFDRLYNYADNEQLWAEVMQAVVVRPLYVPDGSLPDASLPSD